MKRSPPSPCILRLHSSGKGCPLEARTSLFQFDHTPRLLFRFHYREQMKLRFHLFFLSQLPEGNCSSRLQAPAIGEWNGRRRSAKGKFIYMPCGETIVLTNYLPIDSKFCYACGGEVMYYQSGITIPLESWFSISVHWFFVLARGLRLYLLL